MKIDFTANNKNSSGKIIDDIIALIKTNVTGGYCDHICHNETKKPISDSNLDVLYHFQKTLYLVGSKRARLKNRLDKQLQRFVRE